MRLFRWRGAHRVEQLERENSRLRHENEDLRRTRERLEHDAERLQRENEGLRRERDRLKEELDLARRAAKRQAAPFSKGEPKAAPKRPGRRPGAAYGRRGQRSIPAHVDEEIPVPVPDACPDCGGAIAVDGVEDQYQSEIVRRVHVTRFRIQVGHCVTCGERVQGRHPRQTSDAIGAAASQVGPEALALATVLNKDLGLSHGKTVRVLQHAFGLTLTRGGLSQALARIGARCEPTYAQLKATIHASLSVTMDETGWRVAGCPHWVHVATTAAATVFGIFRGRGFEEAAVLIGADYDGFLIHDGWAPYYRFTSAFHQTCTQHLLTRCRELIQRATPAGAAFPRQVKALLQQGLALRDRYVAEEVSSHGLAVATGRLEAALDRLLTRTYRLAENQKLANHLIHESPYLFTYLKCPGLEATNYRGEQAVRPAVVNRKVWGGNRTKTGAHTQEVLMSVLRTCHQQHQDPALLLTDLLRAPRVYVLPLDPPRVPS
jgi:transposase